MAMGKVYRAERGGTHVMRLEGDIGYPMAAQLTQFIEGVSAAPVLRDIIIDLRSAAHIDSTGLGLVARAGNVARERAGHAATVLCPPGDVLRALQAVRFDSVFEIADRPLEESYELTELTGTPESDLALARAILGAHRDLMAVDEHNRREFESVVAQLQQEVDRGRGTPH
jgi:anti-anti-sigma factor